MTLDEQISLIDQMIRENTDYTIRDYLDLMKEIQSVSDSMESKCHHFIFHQTIANNADAYFHQLHPGGHTNKECRGNDNYI